MSHSFTEAHFGGQWGLDSRLCGPELYRAYNVVQAGVFCYLRDKDFHSSWNECLWNENL